MLDASTNSTYATAKWKWWIERNQLQNDSKYKIWGTTPAVCTNKSWLAICAVAQVLPISQLKFEGGPASLPARVEQQPVLRNAMSNRSSHAMWCNASQDSRSLGLQELQCWRGAMRMLFTNSKAVMMCKKSLKDIQLCQSHETVELPLKHIMK